MADTPAGRPLRVAQIVTGLVLGGGGQVMSAIARNVDRSRFHVDFYCVIEGGPLREELERLGFHVTVQRAFDYRRRVGVYSIREILILARHLRRGGYDIVHTHLFQADVVGRIAALLAGVPIVVKTLHNMGRWKGRPQLLADRLLARRTARVVCVSEYQRQAVLQQERLAPGRVVTISNGVDVSRFAPAVDRARLLASAGFGEGGPIVGTVGRLIEEKGHIHLLQAIPLILRRHPDARFLIVGDGRLRPRLASFLAGKPFRDRVNITGLRPDVPEMLSIMDVFVFPSLSEGFPIAPIEAMAARRPVACSKIPQLDGVVIDGETGLSYPPADPPALAAAVCRLLDDPPLRERLAQNAFRLVSETYTEAHMMRAYESLYTELARDHDPRTVRSTARRRLQANPDAPQTSAQTRAPVGAAAGGSRSQASLDPSR